MIIKKTSFQNVLLELVLKWLQAQDEAPPLLLHKFSDVINIDIFVFMYNVKSPRMKVAHLLSYYVEKYLFFSLVSLLFCMNTKCIVTTLQMSFTYNKKPLKNPTNFSSTHVRICVKDATPVAKCYKPLITPTLIIHDIKFNQVQVLVQVYLLITDMSSRFFENQPDEICSHLRDKASKGTFLKPEKLQNHSNEEKGKEKKK